jgi:hypothetical protein
MSIDSVKSDEFETDRKDECYRDSSAISSAEYVDNSPVMPEDQEQKSREAEGLPPSTTHRTFRLDFIS